MTCHRLGDKAKTMSLLEDKLWNSPTQFMFMSCTLYMQGIIQVGSSVNYLYPLTRRFEFAGGISGTFSLNYADNSVKYLQC
jgi:hypothetical protein